MNKSQLKESRWYKADFVDNTIRQIPWKEGDLLRNTKDSLKNQGYVSGLIWLKSTRVTVEQRAVVDAKEG